MAVKSGNKLPDTTRIDNQSSFNQLKVYRGEDLITTLDKGKVRLSFANIKSVVKNILVGPLLFRSTLGKKPIFQGVQKMEMIDLPPRRKSPRRLWVCEYKSC
jgi:hypothetical protein